MSEEKRRRKLRQPETVRSKVEASSKNEVKTGKIRSVFKKILYPITIIFRPLRWLGKRIIPSYFKGSWAELKLVKWPSRRETRQMTTAVVLFAIVLGFAVTTIDFGLDKLFKKVILKQ